MRFYDNDPIKFPWYVVVDSETFGCRCLGIIQHVDVEDYPSRQGYPPQYDVITVTVRLELDDDHPAVQDAIGDGFDPTQAEFIDVVPANAVRPTDASDVPFEPQRFIAERLRREHEAQRPKLPDLDAALRTRAHRTR